MVFTIVNDAAARDSSHERMTHSTGPLIETEPAVGAEPAAARLGAVAHARDAVPSLPEAHRTIPITPGLSWFKKILAFAGPGYLVAVGYMDPGNWATDLGGGSKFGYTLLSVILLSNLMAMLLQALSAKLGIVTGRDLAQACRESYSQPVAIALVGRLRNCHCGVRPGRSAGLGGRAETALRAAAAGRRADHRAGCADRAGAAGARLPVDRSVCGYADRSRLRRASPTKSFSRSRCGAKRRWVSSRAWKFCAIAKCCTSPSASWAPR